VSALTALVPWTISLILRGGTLISFESLYSVILRGLKNSSFRISPGWIGDKVFGMVLMVIGNLSDTFRLNIFSVSLHLKLLIMSALCYIITRCVNSFNRKIDALIIVSYDSKIFLNFF